MLGRATRKMETGPGKRCHRSVAGPAYSTAHELAENQHRMAFRETPGYILKMLERAATEDPPIFPYSEEADASWWDTEGAADAHLMLPLFKFLAMRKLSGHMLAKDPWQQRNTPTPVSPSSGIAEIDLAVCDAGQNGFWDWIGSCKALRSFRYTHGGTGMGQETFNPRALFQSLSLQKESLESILIRSEDFHDPTETQESMGFAEFTVLNHLSIGLQDLVGINEDEEPITELRDTLPYSLETLHFYECVELFGWAVEQLKSLIDVRHMPNLATLTLESPVAEDSEHQQRLDHLGYACKEAGICLNTISTGGSGVRVWVEDPDQPGLRRICVGSI